MTEAEQHARLDEFDRRVDRIERMLEVLVNHLDVDGPAVGPSGVASAV